MRREACLKKKKKREIEKYERGYKSRKGGRREQRLIEEDIRK